MKFLNDNDYKSLKQKADHFDSIAQAIVAAGENITAADVTAETVIEALQKGGSGETGDITALQARVNELESLVSERDNTITGLNAQIADFNGAAAGDPSTIIPDGEPGSKEEDIATFADKNKGDTQAILERCKKEGLI